MIDKCTDCVCINKSSCSSYLNRQQRYRRLKSGNKNTKSSERTLKGKLVRTYCNMKNRCKGLVKPHLYKGKDILDKEAFYSFSLNSTNYQNLFINWVKSNYERSLSPTIDRKDPDKGYTLDNIGWVAHFENSKNTRRWLKN